MEIDIPYLCAIQEPNVTRFSYILEKGSLAALPDSDDPPLRCPQIVAGTKGTGIEQIAVVEHVLKNPEDGESTARVQLSAAIMAERVRREALWASLLAAGGPTDVPRALPRALGIYGNQAGIFVPNAETRTLETPRGIALSFLNTGRHYDDELTDTGVIYHYPTTGRSGHDASEIEASKAAYRASLPVFVIGPGRKSTTRTVYRGYIEDLDDRNRVMLITFTRSELPPPPPLPTEHDEAFRLTIEDDASSYSARRNRPNQVRFAYDVYKRYGHECAVCGLSIQGLLQAAHLLAKKRKGSDDPRNGLPLCANHHLAFDRGYWCMDTDLMLHASPTGPALDELAITRKDLLHLPRAPHLDAVNRVWGNWTAATRTR
jgi:hypothetical protein